jgi:hypothetical protein
VRYRRKSFGPIGGGLAAKCDRGAAARRSVVDFRRRCSRPRPACVAYGLAAPANRYGSNVYSAAQLKTIQEVFALTVFGVFSVVYLRQAITWIRTM